MLSGSLDGPTIEARPKVVAVRSNILGQQRNCSSASAPNRREWHQLMRWHCRPRRGKIARCAAISALLRRNGTPPQPFPSGGAMIHEGQVRSSVCGRSSVEDCERRSLAAGRRVLVVNHAKHAWLGGAAHMPCKLKVAVQSVEGRAVTRSCSTRVVQPVESFVPVRSPVEQ